MLRYFVLALVGLIAVYCSKPTPRDLDGKIKGKASLRLADGSTISQDDADEYRPQIVKLSDGYLVLAFGSNRACAGCTSGAHNIFMSKSLTAFDGVSLPFFDVPKVLQPGSSPLNAANALDFALVASGLTVAVYVNLPNIQKIPVNNPADPEHNVSQPTPISNTHHNATTILCANADGNRLFGVNDSGDVYVFDPDVDTSVNATYQGLQDIKSGIFIRPDTANATDAFMTTWYGGSLALAGGQVIGPILNFDLSVGFSGLLLTSFGSFYADNAQSDLVLFSANNGISDDMYVVTSHTAADLWSLAGFFGGGD